MKNSTIIAEFNVKVLHLDLCDGLAVTVDRTRHTYLFQ